MNSQFGLYSLWAYSSFIYMIKKISFFLFFLALGNAIAQPSYNFGDEKYRPNMGQSGKDVIWIPTGNELVTQMLKTANVGPADLVYDLGAGDGKIAIAAAKDFGARAVGIEYNADMAALGQRNAERAGVANRVKIIQGDIFKEDFSMATVVTLYLLPELNFQLRPTILKMKPGTRVVSHAFDMGDWQPDAEIDTPARGYFWVVPANVAGEWVLNSFDSQGATVLNLSQKFQYVGGNITLGKKTQPILNPKLMGDTLLFSYTDNDNNLRSVRLKFDDAKAKGEENSTYMVREFSGFRR
ncbi:class I SAM-dependent methyltransferase [Polynucleobacter sp. 15G-AUS-farblos]|uniref:class I SAM-dependent methyltransferase n=1 Tax=Polynucleobacter sp. 15G-AUS-farblos TaxID=2689094 RepID=UPI002102957F|nr:class I SAM-dependent methyltransferase [Polynucleobacter sp. 15G-AUS-farblos]